MKAEKLNGEKIDCKIVSKERAFWENMLEKFHAEEKSLKDQAMLTGAIIETIKKKIKKLK